MKKRLLAALLSLCLLAGLLPATALAAGDVKEIYVSSQGDDDNGDGTEQSPYASLSKALEGLSSVLETDITVYVASDLEISDGLTINASGKTITIQSESGSSAASLNKTAKFEKPMFTVMAGTVTFQNITLDGGGETYAMDDSADCNAGGIFVSGGNVTLASGAVVSNFHASLQKGAWYAGGVKLKTGSLTVKDGAVVTKNVGYDGGGIMVTGGTFTMEGGEVSYNEATGYGGGVYVAKDTGNQADTAAAISGGTITGNYVSGTGGGAVLIHGNSSVTITGDTKITGNAAAQSAAAGTYGEIAGGVWLLQDTSKLTVGGSVQITGNYVGVDEQHWNSTSGLQVTEGAIEKNVYLTTGTTIAIDSTSGLTSGAKIGVFTQAVPSSGKDVKIATNAKEADKACFVSDNAADSGVVFKSDELYLSVDARERDLYVSANGNDDTGTGDQATPYATLGKAYETANDGGAIKVLTDLEISSGAAITIGSKSVTIEGVQDGEGQLPEITLATSANLLRDSNSSSGTVTLKNITVKGSGKDEQRTSGPVYLQGGGLVLDGGAVIKDIGMSGTFSSADRGIITLEGSGVTLMMKGNSSIENCAANAGTVRVTSGSTFNMQGGTIKGCDSRLLQSNTVEGSAVYVNQSTMNMSGGTITGCGTEKGEQTRGTVYLHTSGGTIHISGGSITGNTAMYGGGVFMDGGTLKLSGTPTIAENVGKEIDSEISNIYLGDGQSVTIDSSHLSKGANLGIYTDTKPTSGSDVKIAAGANADDAAHFVSDYSTQAGILYCDGGSSSGGTCSATGHQHAKGTLWLSVDARAKLLGQVDPATGEGYLSVDSNAAFKYALLDQDGNAISGVKAYDKNGNELSPDDKGWYSTANGPITFKPIPAGSEAQVASTGAADESTAPADAQNKTDAAVPAVDEAQLSASVVDDGQGNKKAELTIDPAAQGMSYALVDENGDAVEIDGNTWLTAGTDGKVVFTGLDCGKAYKVVAVPTSEAETTDASDLADSSAAVSVKTPSAGFTDVSGKDVSNAIDPADKTKSVITVSPTVSGQEYAVRDPETGEIVGDWKTGTGNALTFDSLNPNKKYEVVTREAASGGNPASVPGKAVPVPAASDMVQAGDLTGGVDSQDNTKTSVTFPTKSGKSYIVVDENGNPVGSAVTGTGRPATVGGLEPDKDYRIIAVDSKDAADAAKNPGSYAGTSFVAPSLPVSADAIKREATSDTDKTDKITVTGEAGYSYALRDQDGNYYTTSGTVNTPATSPSWQDATSGSASIEFAGLPMDKTFEVVKVKTDNKNNSGAVPGATAVKPLPGVVSADALTAGVEKDGDGFLTVANSDSGYDYVVTDEAGTVLAVQTGNGGTLTFPDLLPGQKLRIFAAEKGQGPSVGDSSTVARATETATPVTGTNTVMTAGKDSANDGKTALTVSPTSSKVKYAVVDGSGNVVGSWQQGTGSALTFGGLDPNKEYKIVTSAEENPSNSVTTTDAPSTPVKTPSTGALDESDSASKPAVTSDRTSITINPTESGKIYEIVNPATGEVVKSVTGDGKAMTVSGLSSGTSYQIRVRDDASSLPVVIGSVSTSSGGSGSGGSSGGGGGSTSSGNNSVSTGSVKNGSVSVSPQSAKKGDTVTVTVRPASGYELDTLTVTDAKGNALPLTDKGNGKYTFTMPDSKVTVNAAFKEISGAPVPTTGFVDVPAGAYYYDAVQWAVENGITNGASATMFSPDMSCTRAQMVTFLWRAAGSPKVSGANPFTDVKSGSYYYDAVLWAVEKGVTVGTSSTTFSPDQTVTRSQTVTFLYRAAGSPAVTGGSAFADVDADAYYAGAVQWAVQNGITNGTSASAFSPNADCTRAQIVTFMYRNAK